MPRHGFPIRRVLLAALLLAFLGACNQGTPETVTLTVTVDGTGTGTVTSDPAGIDVTSGDAAATLVVATGDAVTLTATPAAGSMFGGWTGACTGTDSCTIDMDADAEVVATFTLLPDNARTLTVTVDGAGTGTVTSVPAGIDVTSGDAPDAHAFADGTTVTLTASAAAGSRFDGWTGACTGTDPCTLDMDADAAVTATFGLTPVGTATLTVAAVAGGAAAGSVTSDLPGIDVTSGDAPDSHDFAVGDVVTLTATAINEAFSGWVGGGCDDVREPECVVTMSANTLVTATFNDVQTLTVRTGANSDDGVEFLGDSEAGQLQTPPIWLEGWVWVNRTTLDLGWAPFHNLTEAAFRFPGVTVPADARVVSAVLQVTAAAAETSGGGFPTTSNMTLTIEGEKSLAPAALVQPIETETNFGVTTRDRTTASVTWDITGTWADGNVRQAPDAAAILQEIINQDGWVSGNPVMLMLKGGAVGAYRRVDTNDSGAPVENHPTLLIEFVVMPPL